MDDLLRALSAVLATEPDLVAAWLYGSRARGEERPGSDVDVAVLLTDAPPVSFAGLRLDLEGRLEAAVGLPTQLLIANRAPADLVHRVLRDGVLLVENDPAARVRFEVRRRREYLDLLPALDEYRRGA